MVSLCQSALLNPFFWRSTNFDFFPGEKCHKTIGKRVEKFKMKIFWENVLEKRKRNYGIFYGKIMKEKIQKK